MNDVELTTQHAIMEAAADGTLLEQKVRTLTTTLPLSFSLYTYPQHVKTSNDRKGEETTNSMLGTFTSKTRIRDKENMNLMTKMNYQTMRAIGKNANITSIFKEHLVPPLIRAMNLWTHRAVIKLGLLMCIIFCY